MTENCGNNGIIFLPRINSDATPTPSDTFQFDLDEAADCAPHRNTELISAHISEPGGDQLVSKLSALHAELTIAIKHQSPALIPATN
jgi:hypothetical protein